jgi:hypothetical protein
MAIPFRLPITFLVPLPAVSFAFFILAGLTTLPIQSDYLRSRAEAQFAMHLIAESWPW